MAQVNAGRVRFISRGQYNNSTQYYLFDLIDYNGSSYFAKENTQGNLPTNTTYWQLVAEKGNTGNVGPQGPIGETGNGIASINKTSTSGLVDTYTITYTNGTTTTFTVTNGQTQDISGKEDKSNKVTSISSSSTDTQYPSALSVYNYVDEIVGDINTLLDTLNRTEV
jgi:hypothetical protein